jgi:hypothetical protein
VRRKSTAGGGGATFLCKGSLSPCGTRVCANVQAINYCLSTIDIRYGLVYYVVNTALAVCRPLMRGPAVSLRLARCGRVTLIERWVREEVRR